MYYLAPLLSEDQPFYAIQDPSLNRDIPVCTSIEGLADVHVAALQGVRPKGPYHLAGWSFGAIVALEMAQRLVAAGEEVGLVFILDMRVNSGDTEPFLAGQNRLIMAWKAMSILVSIMSHTGPYLKDGFYLMLDDWERSESGRSVFSRCRKQLWRMLRDGCFPGAPARQLFEEYPHLKTLPAPPLPRCFRLLIANMLAIRRYKPRDYPGRVVLFRASESLIPGLAGHDPTMGWGIVALRGVEVVEVSGNHVQLMLAPAIRRVADVMQDRMGVDLVARRRGAFPAIGSD
jgi:thioesterase domain-containing protein